MIILLEKSRKNAKVFLSVDMLAVMVIWKFTAYDYLALLNCIQYFTSMLEIAFDVIWRYYWKNIAAEENNVVSRWVSILTCLTTTFEFALKGWRVHWEHSTVCRGKPETDMWYEGVNIHTIIFLVRDFSFGISPCFQRCGNSKIAG